VNKLLEARLEKRNSPFVTTPKTTFACSRRVDWLSAAARSAASPSTEASRRRGTETVPLAILEAVQISPSSSE
jgi:hypothetical protein